MERVSTPFGIAFYFLFSVSECVSELTISQKTKGQQPDSALIRLLFRFSPFMLRPSPSLMQWVVGAHERPSPHHSPNPGTLFVPQRRERRR